MSERLNYTIDNIKEIRQDIRELKMYIMDHMEKENKEITDIKIELASLKVKSSLWGSVSGAIVAVGTLFASSLFGHK